MIAKVDPKAFGQKLRHADILASHPFDVFVETIIFGILLFRCRYNRYNGPKQFFNSPELSKSYFNFFFSPTSDATTETDTSVVPEPNKERLGRESNGLQRQTVVQVLHLDKQPTTIFFGRVDFFINSFCHGGVKSFFGRCSAGIRTSDSN